MEQKSDPVGSSSKQVVLVKKRIKIRIRRSSPITEQHVSPQKQETLRAESSAMPSTKRGTHLDLQSSGAVAADPNQQYIRVHRNNPPQLTVKEQTQLARIKYLCKQKWDSLSQTERFEVLRFRSKDAMWKKSRPVPVQMTEPIILYKVTEQKPKWIENVTNASLKHKLLASKEPGHGFASEAQKAKIFRSTKRHNIHRVPTQTFFFPTQYASPSDNDLSTVPIVQTYRVNLMSRESSYATVCETFEGFPPRPSQMKAYHENSATQIAIRPIRSGLSDEIISTRLRKRTCQSARACPLDAADAEEILDERLGRSELGSRSSEEIVMVRSRPRLERDTRMDSRHRWSSPLSVYGKASIICETESKENAESEVDGPGIWDQLISLSSPSYTVLDTNVLLGPRVISVNSAQVSYWSLKSQ